jgi:hypothetical protein
MRLIHVWRSRTPNGVRCAHVPSDITTIMVHKQWLDALNTCKLRIEYHVAEPVIPRNCRKKEY